MRRRIVRIVGVLVLLALVASLAGYCVLKTDLPRRWVLAAVSDKLGIAVTADVLSVGWTGRTTIRQMSARMPLHEDAFLSVATVRLSHTSLPMMLLGRSAAVRLVRMERPRLDLRRDEDGHWNIEDVVTRLGGGTRSGKRPGPAALPQLDIRDAVVRITDPNGTSQSVGPIRFQGRPQKGPLWTFSLELDPAVAVQGRLVSGRDWTHDVGMTTGDMGPLIRETLGRDLSPVTVAGQWEGRFANGCLTGRLQLDALRLGSASVRGDVRVEAGPEGLILCPDPLVFREPNLMGEPLHLSEGSVRVRGDGIAAAHLAGRAGQLTVRLDSQWNRQTRVGELSGSWAGMLAGDGSQHQGTCRIDLKSPAFGRKEAHVSVTAEAQTTLGSWNVSAQAHGAGGDWRRSQWHLSLPTLAWSRKGEDMDMAGAVADIHVAWPAVRLAALHLPTAEKTLAKGQLAAETRRWSVEVDARGLQPEGWDRGRFDLSLKGQGHGGTIHISEFAIRQGQRTVVGKGQLSTADRTLQGVHVAAQWPALSSGAGEAKADGWWRCEADVAGRLEPRALQVTGVLSGQNVALGKQIVGDVNVVVEAEIDASEIAVATRPFTLLGGRWQIDGHHDLGRRLTQLTLAVDDLSLGAAADMAGSPLEAEGRGRARLQLAVPGFDIHQAVASGSWSAEDVDLPPVAATQARGRLRISDGLVRFDEIVMENGPGRARGSMQFRLDRPQCVSIDVDTEAWPVRLKNRPLALRVDTDAEMQVDILAKTLNGQGSLSGTVLMDGDSLGDFKASAFVHERALEVREFGARMLDGVMEGTARIRLDQWTGSSGAVRWRDMEPKRLGTWWPQLAGLEGKVSGSLTAVQTDDQPRPPEPMQVELRVDVADGRIGQASVGGCRALAYVGARRLLVDRSTFQLLGGHIHARARLSSHVDDLYACLVADVNALDVNELAHVFDPNAQDMPGRLAGRTTLLLSAADLSLGGEADLVLTQSDLAASTIVQTLYNGLSLDFREKKPTGTGQVRILLEGKALKIPSFAYFNRGVEIRGAGEIRDFRLGSDSPIAGYAVGSTRVLKGISLPGVRQLDRLMGSFQAGVASVQIGGTLGEATTSVVPLPAVSSAFRRLLWSQLRQ